jgi:multicomponent K+:H+ antiporter subunit G
MNDLPLWLQMLAALLLVAGGVFALTGALGLLRLGDFYQRLHAPTKATTLGVGGLLLAAMVLAWARGESGLGPLLITLFLFITAPVSAQLLAQAAMQRGEPSQAGPPPDDGPGPDGAAEGGEASGG